MTPTTNTIHWLWKDFDDLGPQSLYQILKLRAEVFIVEQNCPYLDLDGKDQIASHLLGYRKDKLVAYARTFVENDFQWLGRILTCVEARGQGLGVSLMETAILRHDTEFPMAMHAQSHLSKFYERFGFKRTGEVFLEDGIPHVLMVRPQKNRG